VYGKPCSNHFCSNSFVLLYCRYNKHRQLLCLVTRFIRDAFVLLYIWRARTIAFQDYLVGDRLQAGTSPGRTAIVLLAMSPLVGVRGVGLGNWYG
jgi:hypothetical protein